MRGPVELGAHSACVGRGGATPAFDTDDVGGERIVCHTSLVAGSEQLTLDLPSPLAARSQGRRLTVERWRQTVWSNYPFLV